MPLLEPSDLVPTAPRPETPVWRVVSLPLAAVAASAMAGALARLLAGGRP